MTKILLVEDDEGIVKNLSLLLKKEGFLVDAVSTQKEALSCIEEGEQDLILLDVALPDGSGFTVCNAARRRGDTPVIFLTASDQEASVVAGFDLGACDYITKPFRPMELISRIKNALRRTGGYPISLQVRNLRIDTDKGAVYKDGEDVFLSALEYRLLLLFLNNKGAVLSRARLLESLWDVSGDFVNDNTLTVYIKRLREKIEDDPQNPQVIKTVRGMGYRLGE